MPGQALAFAPHPATDRASLAQAMQAAAHPAGAKAAPKTTVIAKNGPLPIAPPLRLAGAQKGDREDAKATGHKPGMPPRSKVAGMY